MALGVSEERFEPSDHCSNFPKLVSPQRRKERKEILCSVITVIFVLAVIRDCVDMNRPGRNVFDLLCALCAFAVSDVIRVLRLFIRRLEQSRANWRCTSIAAPMISFESTSSLVSFSRASILSTHSRLSLRPSRLCGEQALASNRRHSRSADDLIRKHVLSCQLLAGFHSLYPFTPFFASFASLR
jgi:hypothetical protein